MILGFSALVLIASTAAAATIQPNYAQSTHVEITYEAFFVLPEGAIRAEFVQYIGGTTGHDCSTLFPDSGTSITEGAYEEDCDLHFFDHFWDPDTNEGLPFNESALTRAKAAYELAVAFYEAGEVAAAYYELGRVAHLLEDMAQPAHVHLDVHGPFDPPDNYEEICSDHGWRWSATSPPGDVTQANTYVGYDANGKLRPLDYATLPSSLGTAFIASSRLEGLFLNLAETADAFESEDVSADTDALQFGQARTTITWHTKTTPPFGLIGEFTEAEVLLHADTLAPLAIRYVASLYQLFWDETHPPTVTTDSASAPGQTTATVSASVNPNGAATKLYFDYGKTASYGITATYGSVGSGTAITTKSYNLTGLSCDTVYHYKARAENGAAAPASGVDRTFTTTPCTQSCYSLTATRSPSDGGSVNVNTGQNCSGGYTSGTSVAVSASPASGYQFSGWTAANCTLANSAALSTTCTMTGAGNASVSAQFTGTTPADSELLINGAFASGSTGWVRSGNFFADSRFAVCRSCPGYAYLSNTDGTSGNNLNGTLYQAVTIPANATSATLTFWYSITTQEVTTNNAYDVLYVSIQDITAGSAMGIAELSNLTSTSGYVKRTANLMAFAGHTVWLHFSGSTDGGKPTVFRVDDASIQVTSANCTSFSINPSSRSPSSSSGSRTVTITGSPTGCQGGAWSASGNGSWLTVSPTSGTGSSSTTVSWSQNPFTSQRSANAMVAGNVFSVTQDGASSPTCTSFTLNTSSWSPTSTAGSQNVALIGAPNGCQSGSWSASGNGSWLTVSPTSGTGPESVTVSWSQNPNVFARSGNAMIAGNTFPVTQGAAPGGPIQAYTFTHLAGSDVGAGYFDGTGSTARFSYPAGVAVDSSGNIYVVDTRNDTIRKITAAGQVTTLAGLAGIRGSTDGTGSTARFAWPGGVAIDGAGNVYVADSSNHTIRKITPTGVVTTLAGLGGSTGGADGMGSAARFWGPKGVATDSAGNVYVADSANHTIRKVTAAGVVTTLAGLASTSGSSDGTGNAARFNEPTGVATDRGGNVYVAERSNHTIRKITPAGVVTTLAGLAGSAGNGDGTGSAARFWFPSGVATDAGNNVYVAEDMHIIRKITPGGVVTTLAGQVSTSGSADGTGAAAQFRFPRGLATDAAGNVYVADSYNQTIRKITAGGVVTTVAGLAGDNFGSADGSGSAARFNSPFGVTADNGGSVYVADSSNLTIRKITPWGEVSTFAGLAGARGSADGTGTAARFRYTYGVATDSGGNVYVADSANNTIRKITSAGVVTTVAGLAGSSGSGSTDGTGDAARFNYPYGVATDNVGNAYVADTFNHTIRKMTPAGVVTTIAGLAGSTGGADGTGNAARFNSPMGVAADGSGNVYVADTINYTVRKITPAGVVTTLAGLAGSSGSVDGTGNAARFNLPTGVEIDGAGDIYVADSRNNAIRKITPEGVVTTLAGLAQSYGSTDGVGGAVRFDDPSGLALDNAGNLYVGDRNNHAIRVGRRAIADVGSIDSVTGSVGVTRQLDVAPRDGTSWQWRVIRRPSGSAAQLSSTVLRNPTFTPDVADLYQFQLIASNSVGMSVTLVSLLALPAQVTNYTLTVTGAGTGLGTVKGSGIDCTLSGGSASGICSASYASGTSVPLIAAPIGSSSFSGWSGDCSGAGGCSVTMNATKSVSASFAAPPTGRGYYLITACRLVDTRNPAGAFGGPPLASNTTRNIIATGRCGIPSTATALSINVTAVSPGSTGWLTLFPGPVTAPRPSTSTLSYRNAKTRANSAVAGVGTDGSINVYHGGSYPVHFIIDVYGYFQ